jgi:hypothetical protein
MDLHRILHHALVYYPGVMPHDGQLDTWSMEIINGTDVQAASGGANHSSFSSVETPGGR